MLAESFSSHNACLNLAAGKALANMDQNHRKYGVYDRSIYLLHPLYEDTEDTRNSDARHGVSLLPYCHLPLR